jgi:LacI family transcriptional regulator
MASRLKDIANDLGLSVITVSKVLRNHPDISKETKERVMRRAREVNYQPNLAARALVTGRTHCIGLIVPDLVHPFFAELAKGLSAALRQRGYALLLASSEEDAALELREVEHLLARGVDAVILASGSPEPVALDRIQAARMPCVLIDRRFARRQAHFVGADDELIGLMATEHLIAQGCRRIAHIRGPEVSTALGRLKGYQAALRRHSLKSDPKLIVQEATGDDLAENSGQLAMQKLLALPHRPDGVFCYNDPAAMGAMQAILDSGLHLPGDVKLIGCGNVTYAGFLRVPLSSVDQRSDEIGRKAAELALTAIEAEKPLDPQTVYVSPMLAARASSARALSTQPAVMKNPRGTPRRTSNPARARAK